MAWCAGFVISFSVGAGLGLGFYLRNVHEIARRVYNLEAWEYELCRREDELVERTYELEGDPDDT